jgi:arsenate reductase
MVLSVLFVCIHNSARSQMAETYLNLFGTGCFSAQSAGIEAGTINPLVQIAMAEEGFDLSNKGTNSVFDFYEEGRRFDIVIKVCDQANGQRCPIFPSSKLNLNWNFPDPSTFQGNDEEKLQQIRAVRDAIRDRVKEFVRDFPMDEFSND